MKIVCSFGAGPGEARPWIDDLAVALPGAAVVGDEGDEGLDADYAVVWRASQQFFDRHRRLKAIFAAGAGVDALLSLALPSGVPVVRLEDAGMGEQMADYVVHALLRYFRRFDTYAALQAGRTWQPLPAERKADWPVGVLGLGALGQTVAQAVRALGFPVAGWTRSPREVAGIETFAGPAGFAPFLARTRVLVDVLPLTADTRDLVDAEVFARLRSPAYFINVARGAHVVESDLLEALASGHLAGAALDVCRDEPARPHHPFWRHPRIALTPHIAAMTLRRESVAQIAFKIAALERSEPVDGVISHERGY